MPDEKDVAAIERFKQQPVQTGQCDTTRLLQQCTEYQIQLLINSYGVSEQEARYVRVPRIMETLTPTILALSEEDKLQLEAETAAYLADPSQIQVSAAEKTAMDYEHIRSCSWCKAAGVTDPEAMYALHATANQIGIDTRYDIKS